MDVPRNLAELEVQLQELSHEIQGLKLIQSFATSLGKTGQRQIVFNAKGALVREPILYEDVLAKGLAEINEEPFVLLQGDIVSTEAAYFMGERLTGGMKFVVATSTCDLMPERRQYAALLRVQAIEANDRNAKQLLGELLKFNSTQYMYLPPLPDDSENVIGNRVVFDGIVQVQINDLLMATRYLSLSLVGWRIFGSLVRTIMVRAGESEVKIRASI